MGDFTLAPGQGPARAVFLPLARVQRDLAIEDRVNTLLVGGAADAGRVRDALAAQIGAADLGLRVDALPEHATIVVESRSGLISDDIAQSAQASAERGGLTATPVLTWLATRMTVGERSVPYSLVSAVGPDGAGDAGLARALGATTDPAPIVLNEWTARELQAAAGAALELEYLRWADEGRLVTERAPFRVAGVVPMRGLMIDRRWAPDYPGITTATDVTDWDPPFPIDLGLIRPQDEAYWDQYRTAPKAFIALAAGQALWRTRHGQVTSLRLRVTGAGSGAAAPSAAASIAPDAIAALRTSLARDVSPLRGGFNVIDVRRQNLAASSGATDFGAYFSYFSFFLMVSALLLAALFFRLSVEQRLAQIGVLRASGFSLADVRRLLLLEGVVVSAAGAAAGIALAIGWAAAMMLALRTWWVDAVGTTLLRLHVDPASLAIGAAATTVASLLAIAWTVRALNRTTPRALIAGSASEPATTRPAARWIAPALAAIAILLSVLSLANVLAPAGGFFGAGALVLVAGLAAFRSWIVNASPAGTASLIALGIRNASWRRGRSLTVAGLVAAAVFLLVSVDAFRKTAGATGTRDSGTGGFALIAESALPIVHDLRTRDGREAVGLTDGSGAGEAALAGVDIFSLRLRPGDDASCLNLYQPKQPRIAGVPARLIEDGRFSFARTIATDQNGRSNPWTLLGAPDAEGVVPAVVDQTSLQYVLHAAVGDEITVDADTSRPLRLRIVASLADSVMQGEILIDESAFRMVFPDIAGYRMFLVSVDPATPERIDAVTRLLEERLDPLGFDAEDTSRRLEAFHRVENTYLSTFQALGGLGLVLGCLGLVAVVLRNVLERRRELALLGAAGFTGADLQKLVAVEHLALVGVGLAVGIAAAALAVAPVVVARGGGAPWRALVWVLPVAAAGFAAAYGATRSLRRMPLVASLRSE
jgi:ABC-type antimicrobial peptide transport system permease subunit